MHGDGAVFLFEAHSAKVAAKTEFLVCITKILCFRLAQGSGEGSARGVRAPAAGVAR